MGLFWDNDEMEAPTPIVLRVPANLEVSDRWKKAIAATEFYQARKIFEKQGRSYPYVLRKMRENDTHFVEEAYLEALLLPAQYKGLTQEYRKAKKENPGLTPIVFARKKRREIFNIEAQEVIGRGNYTGTIYSLRGNGEEETLDSDDIQEGEDLEGKLTELHDRIHKGSYRARPGGHTS